MPETGQRVIPATALITPPEDPAVPLAGTGSPPGLSPGRWAMSDTGRQSEAADGRARIQVAPRGIPLVLVGTTARAPMLEAGDV
ncbi:hypothetical protein CLV68_2332 [Actinokineospora cianjurensis]|uniref:Uncharacterized protein n=1 Tax=Actinokineospora cianjurensis TaxID=585224 RepID=A0A421BBS7_9PSEU|nr:hypothetical protein CLV68_2332 [Actinokineospora cianjurensis]